LSINTTTPFSPDARLTFKNTILGVAGKEQSERRSSASAAIAQAPGPDTEPRGRRPRLVTLSPVPSTLVLVDRDLRSCSIVTY
jgi:hypothetical protein